MQTTMQTKSYGKYTGAILEAPAKGASLARLEKNFVTDTLKKSGYLVCRGFEADVTAFSAFVAAHSTRVTLDPARQFSSAHAQKVDAGYDEIGLHIENGAGPLIPEVCWFYCEKAAREGSQTTVCDGKVVLERMQPALKDLFRNREIVYTRRVAEPIWKTFVLHHLPHLSHPGQVTFSHVRQITGQIKGLEASPNDDGSIHYSFTVPAILSSVLSDQAAFANSILGPSFNYEKPGIAFRDGGELPGELVDRIKAVTAACTEEIDWQDGDVVIIDNTRVMHGRRKITDRNRTIYNALSFVH